MSKSQHPSLADDDDDDPLDSFMYDRLSVAWDLAMTFVAVSLGLESPSKLFHRKPSHHHGLQSYRRLSVVPMSWTKIST